MIKITVLVLSLFFGQSVFALDQQGSLNKEPEALRNNDYKATFKLYKDLSEQGNSIAQSNLALMYAKGEGVNQDYQQAKAWFGKSCDNGYQAACDEYQKLDKK